MFDYKVNQREYNNIQLKNREMQQSSTQQQPQCYFCIQHDLQTCITRSLYHKYNQNGDKMSQMIEQLAYEPKQKAAYTRKYQEIKHLVDDEEHMRGFMHKFTAKVELVQLLEYYKYRKYVPLFSKSSDNSKIAEDIHLYYYDKLKLYYNQVKRKLDITIDPSQLSDSSNSVITKSELSQLDQSKVLPQFVSKNSKQSISNLETQSKALQGLIAILKKQEAIMKKIKTLRTQDCTREKQHNPFNDNLHKKNNLANYLMQQNKAMMKKKNHKIFFRYIQQSKSHKIIETMNKINMTKRVNIDQLTRSIYNQKQKGRSKSESLNKLKKQSSINKLPRNQRQKSAANFKKKATLAQKQQRKSAKNQNTVTVQKLYIKTLPKVQMKFNIRTQRSQSTASLKYPNYQSQVNKNYQKKQKDIINQYHTLRAQSNHNPKQQKIEKAKKMQTKTPLKMKSQIEQNDNLASINKRKLEELKLKSQRKKQGRK